MTNETARNLVGCSVLLAIGGALAMLPTSEQLIPITGRIVPVVEMVRPEPLAEWQVETAVKACFEMGSAYCDSLESDGHFSQCVWSVSDRCTVGNTQRVGGW